MIMSSWTGECNPRKTWDSVYVWKWPVKSVHIRLIHFRIVYHRQEEKSEMLVCTRRVSGTCRRCASVLLRSLSYRSSLSALPTRERQLCVGKRGWEGQSSCHPTSLNRAVEYLGSTSTVALLNDRFDRKALQLLWRRVRRLDLEYFVPIRSTWTIYVKLTNLRN